MALVVDIRITDSRGYTNRIELLEIRRLEPLDDPTNAANEVHNYSVTSYDNIGRAREATTVKHRYGDMSRTLISNALAALGHPENLEMRS